MSPQIENRKNLKAILHWLLRLAVMMEFIGHGAFGLIGKQSWIPYFQTIGFSESWAWLIMPLVGTVDIFLGLYSFFFPRRILFLYMAFWGFLTATLRPFSGEPIWEFVERSYNMGVPFLFLILHDQKWTWRSMFSIVKTPLKDEILSDVQLKKLFSAVQIICAAMLIGHGFLAAIIQKNLLLGHLLSTGLPQAFNLEAFQMVQIQGFIEIIGGLAVLVWPTQTLLLMILFWKIATEGFFLTAVAPWGYWEWIERGSSYIAPLLGFIVISRTHKDQIENKISLKHFLSKLFFNYSLQFRSKKNEN